MRAHTMVRLGAVIVATVLATTGGLWAFCDSSVETYAVFQCSDRAYFAPVPGPFGPNDVTGVFWQIGFGNSTLNTGDGTDGSGVRSKSNFNGNDSGTFPPDILDASIAFPAEGFPAGALCLGSNNWANAGIDGCCDNPRPGVGFNYQSVNAAYGPYYYLGDDDILNPYFGTYFSGIGYPGYYSRGSLMDYPTAVLLKTPADEFFAIAAVTNMDRLNSGNGDNGTCHLSAPGSNPAACDIRQGFYTFANVSNGNVNVIDGASNVVPWQVPPTPFPTITAGNPNDPNSDLTVDLTWTPPTIHSDGLSVPSNNPTHAPADPNAAGGPGVVDIAARFGLARYQLEVAEEIDPTFSAPTQTVTCLLDPNRSDAECTGPAAATLVMKASQCVRIRTLFGVPPRETTLTNSANCRNGRCGDIGYEVVGDRECPGTATCLPSAELCNGLDDDCDGDVDEDFQIGLSCTGTGECANAGAGLFECLDPNTAVCSTDPGGSNNQAVSELCDSLDNDCDASTDEDFTLGGACNGIGECATDPNGGTGLVECNAADPNLTQCSLDPGGSQDQAVGELCDALDNDCDASTDEDFNLGGACTGAGECGAGVNECSVDPNGVPVDICSTEAGGSGDQSQPETCDGLDNDCDATTDEDFSVGQSCAGTGECAGDPNAVFECLDPNTSVCSSDPGGSNDQSSGELCDGLDNDCDASTDEDFNLGGACTGTGECGAGVFECTMDPNFAICSSDPGGSSDQSGFEICGNGLDDDCDGDTDETGDPEICDGIDNNCDGQTDEGFNLGQACTGTGSCGGGVLECAPADPNATICSSDPGGTGDQSTPELCDLLDNDCDAVTDEGFDVGQTCTGLGECGAGVLECTGPDPNNAICSTEPGGTGDQSVAEQCDGLDNDCDASTDEDFGVGQACTGIGACGMPMDPNTAMVIECVDPNGSSNATTCSTNPGGSEDLSSPEECDDPALDNDCDGVAEENGICVASFVIESHGPPDPNIPITDQVDCSDPRVTQPRFEWFKGPYDRFRPELSWDPTFPKKKRIKSFVQLNDAFWEPNGKKWKKACKKALKENPGNPVMFIRVFGKDIDLPKGDPNRDVLTPTVDLAPQY